MSEQPTALDRGMATASLHRWDWLVAVLLGAVLLGGGAWRMAPGVTGVYHDDAIYVSTAKALAEGQGYRLINLPDAPLQTKYPFLYPLLLALIWKIWPAFPQNIVIMQWVTLWIGAAAIGLSYLYLIRFGYSGRLAAGLIGLLAATSPTVTYFSTLTMAEMPFLFLTLLALWRVEGALLGPLTTRQAITSGILLALPFLCRTIGASIIIGAVSLLAVRRRPVRWIAAGSAVAASPWLLWSMGAWGIFGQDGGAGYYRDYGGAWMLVTEGALGRIVTTNIGLLLASTTIQGTFGAATILMDWGAKITPALLLGGIAVWLGIAAGAARLRALPWCMAAYGVTVVLWPWPPGRFLVPVAGLLLATGIGTLSNRIPSPTPSVLKTASVIACSLAVAMNLVVLARWGAAGHRSRYPQSFSVEPPRWDSLEASFQWLKAHTSPEDVTVSGLDSMVFLYGGRRSIRMFPHRPDALFYGSSRPAAGTAEELKSLLILYRVRYLVDTPLYAFAEDQPVQRLLDSFRQRYPTVLRPVQGDPSSLSRVYELFWEP